MHLQHLSKGAMILKYEVFCNIFDSKSDILKYSHMCVHNLSKDAHDKIHDINKVIKFLHFMYCEIRQVTTTFCIFVCVLILCSA